jgi:hypothetical protein
MRFEHISILAECNIHEGEIEPRPNAESGPKIVLVKSLTGESKIS